MAVKIIKNGELPMIGKKCECCGCEFKFDLREVDGYNLNKCEYSPYTLYFIRCPYCGMEITLCETEALALGLIRTKKANG